MSFDFDAGVASLLTLSRKTIDDLVGGEVRRRTTLQQLAWVHAHLWGAADSRAGCLRESASDDVSIALEPFDRLDLATARRNQIISMTTSAWYALERIQPFERGNTPATLVTLANVARRAGWPLDLTRFVGVGSRVDHRRLAEAASSPLPALRETINWSVARSRVVPSEWWLAERWPLCDMVVRRS